MLAGAEGCTQISNTRGPLATHTASLRASTHSQHIPVLSFLKSIACKDAIKLPHSGTLCLGREQPLRRALEPQKPGGVALGGWRP